MSDYSKHTYASDYPPGVHWATDEAWRILDAIKPGLISSDVRAYLAGCIAGSLIKHAGEGKPDDWPLNS
jgi:hypothetical protein